MAKRPLRYQNYVGRGTRMTLDHAVRADLRQRGLLPSGRAGAVRWPRPADVDRTYFRGAVLGTAIGDALGRPVEGWFPEDIRKQFGRLDDFVPRLEWGGGPPGMWSDDTQMTTCVARSLIVADGDLDVEHLVQGFVAWLPQGRGVGMTCLRAVERLMVGTPWWESGEPSAGNGAAMRVAPVGLVHVDQINALRVDAALSAVITHADPMAVASAIAQAFIVAWCARAQPGTIDVAALLGALVEVLADVPDPGAVERRHGTLATPVRLVDRLAEVGDMLDLEPEEAFDRLWNGAFVLESLPAALWCFLRTPEDPEEVLITAVHGGHDADTVAAMAGAMVGAYLGEDAFPERWRWPRLEDYENLVGLADELAAVGRSVSTTS